MPLPQPQPTTSDGRSAVVIDVFPFGQNVYFSGGADNVVTGTRLDGPLFTLDSSAVEEKVLEYQYMEWVYIGGGRIVAGGAAPGAGDTVKHSIYAPATVGTSNPGAGAYDKVEIIPSSGLHIYVPNGTTTGNWDIDLEEKLNTNVDFTKVCPVPNEDKTGYFNHDHTKPAATSTTLAPGGDGAFDLFDFDVTLTTYVDRWHMRLGSSEFDPMSASKLILPQWKHKVVLDNVSGNAMWIAWYMLLGRDNIT